MSRQDEVTRLHGEGMSPKEIAEVIGVSRRTVARDLKKLGLVQEIDREARNRRIVELYESGLKQSEVASEVGLTQAMVCRILRQADVEIRKARCPFDLEEAARLINEEGMSHREAGEILGVAQQTISRRLSEAGIETRSWRRYYVNDAFFEVPDLVNCYWAGFLAADGNLSSTGHQVTFRLSTKDVDRVRQFRSDSGVTNPIESYRTNKGHPYCGITVTSQQWHEDLGRHFNVVPAKTSSLQPPNIGDEDLIWAFCRGFFDGDGHVSKRADKINVVGKSVDFITWIVRDVFEAHHRIYENNGSHACYISGEVLQEVAIKLYADSTPETRMHRKYQRLVDGGVL